MKIKPKSAFYGIILVLSVCCLASVHQSSAQLKRAKIQKLDPRLRQAYEKGDKTYNSLFIRVSASKIQESMAQLEKLNISYLQRGQLLILKEALTQKSLDSLLNRAHVLSISSENINPQPDNLARVLDLNLFHNHINSLKNSKPQLRGQNMVISIKEPSYDSLDIDLGGRYINAGRSASFQDTHATEMATIAVGSGNSFVNGRGVADQALHTSTDFSDVIPEEKTYYLSNNIYVENHSYGTEIESFYGNLALLYDQSVRENEYMLHVFSSGNLGTQSAQLGAYASINGYSNLTGNFKHAKNLLTVGATDTLGNIQNRSGKGPAHDGRLKPELVAYSTVGTSNAAALVSGTAILLQQSYLASEGVRMPSHLLRGILMNSAEDVEEAGPDYKSGYGQLDALAAQKIIDNNWYWIDSIKSTENKKSYTLQLNDSSLNLKVMLSYNDKEASANSQKALINDLDLYLISPKGDTILPYVLNPYPAIDSLSLPARRGKDRLNNHEQVQIINPEAGTYQIVIENFNLLTDQNYSINFSYSLENQFQFLNPTAIDNFPFDGETDEYIRWINTFPVTSGDLFWRAVEDSIPGDWNRIKAQVDLTRKKLRWQPPELNTIAQLKMEINDTVFLSDTFTISRPKRLNVALNCSDSILLNWDPIPNADSVELFEIIDFKAEKVNVQIQNNQAFIKQDSITSGLYFLQPYLNGRELIRSYTIDIDLQTQSCYLLSFFARENQDDGVNLEFQLGSVLGIEKIEIDRSEDNTSWQLLDSIASSEIRIENSYLDESPQEGINYYRIRLIFENNATIQSESSNAYFLKDSPFYVYPNPKPSSEDLRIFSNGQNREALFTLMDVKGNVVYQTKLQLNRTIIDIPVNLNGLFLYTITEANSKSYSGKLMFYR